MAADGEDKVAIETIDLLESRLQRLAFYTIGTSELAQLDENHLVDAEAESIPARLQQAEDTLRRLASQSPVVTEILSLC